MNIDDRIRWIRAHLLNSEIFPQMMSDMIIAPPNVVYTLIMNTPSFLKKLSVKEQQIVKAIDTEGFQKLDTSLMYKCIRHFHLVGEPTNQWGAPVLKTSTTQGDDVERLHKLRNNISHLPKAVLSESEFAEFMSTCSEVALRRDSSPRIPGNRFQAEIREYGALQIMDSNLERKYVSLLEENNFLKEQAQQMIGNRKVTIFYGQDVEDRIAGDTSKELSCIVYIYGAHLSDEGIKKTGEFLKKLNESILNVKVQRIGTGSIILYVIIYKEAMKDNTCLHNSLSIIMEKMFPFVHDFGRCEKTIKVALYAAQGFFAELDSREQHQSAVISNPNKPKIIKDPETEEKIVMIVQKPDDEDSSTEVREDIVLKEFKGIVNSEESIKKESPARGIVVICTHTTFKNHAVNLSERQSGFDDKDLMEKSWKLYDNCEVLTFEDERSKFYDKELEEKIKEKIADIQNVKYFVFVLSTHGDERPEKENDDKVHNRHYFYTRDGQFKTQDLMNKINDIEKIDGKMKLFFIQAFRSRVMLSSEKENHLSSETIFEFEEHHRMEKLTIHSESIDVQDARGYMPPPEEDIDNNMAQQPEMENEDTEAIKSETILIPPTEEIPHCDDCIVVFASMAGKYAYSRLHDPMAGSWMIRALHSTLNHYQGGDSVHILDILRGINREVSEKTLLTPLHNSDQCRSHLSILKDELNREFMMENYCEKSYDDLSKLSEKLDHLQNSLELKMGSDSKETRDELVKEIFEVTDSVEKIVGPVVLKAQSCFFHNLAFKDEEMILLKTKIQ